MKFKTQIEYFYKVTDKAVICYVIPSTTPTSIAEEYYNTGAYIFAALNRLEVRRSKTHENFPYSFLKGRYKGVAAYKKNDVYDEESAKKIARRKALRALYRDYYAQNKRIEKQIRKYLIDFADIKADLESKIDTLDKEIVNIAHK